MKTINFIIAMCLSISLFGQGNGQSKIKTIKGKSIIGDILEFHTDSLIVILDEDGIKHQIPFSIIQNVTWKNGPFKRNKFPSYQFLNELSISALIGNANNGFHVGYTLFHNLHHAFNPGIGIGITNMSPNAGVHLIPIYGEVRSFLSSSEKSVFLSFAGGYAWATTNNNFWTLAEGGPYFSPKIGIRLGGEKPMASISYGYHFQKSKYTQVSRDSKTTNEYQFRRSELTLSVMF